ncbi:phage tail protein [Aliidiomarina sp. Khilg15.8]
MLKKLGNIIGDVFKFALGWLMPDVEQDSGGIEIDPNRPDAPIPVTYGTDVVQAKPIFKHTTDGNGKPKNKYLHIVYSLCEGPIEEIEEVFFNEVPSTDKRWKKSNGDPWYRILTRLGEDSQTAFPELVEETDGLWSTQHRCRGVALLYVRYEAKTGDQVWMGEPKVSVRVKGKKILDLRTGQVAWSQNGPMALYDYLTSQRHGFQFSPGRLNTSYFVDAANRTDAGVESVVTNRHCWYDDELRRVVCGQPYTEVVTHPLMACNVTINTEERGFDNVRTLLSGMRGAIPPATGRYKLLIEDEAEPAAHLDLSDIVGDVDYSGVAKKDRFNQVTIRYRNSARGFKKAEVTYPDRQSNLFNEWFEEDNSVILSRSFEMPTIKNTAEALQMAEIISKLSRISSSLSMTIRKRSHTIGLECEDVVAISHPLYGWENRTFRIKEIDDEGGETITLSLVLHEDAIYPWSDKDYSEIDPATNLGDPWNIASPRNLTIELDPSLSNTGKLRWDYDSDLFAKDFEVTLYRLAENEEPDEENEALSESVTTRSIVLPRLDAGNYQASVVARTDLPSKSAPAVLMFSLTVPVSPSDLGLTATNWEVTSRPVLAGVGLGTQFEFDIVEGDGTNHIPEMTARGASAIFTGRMPDTLHTVFVRTINALGASEWVQESIETAMDTSVVDPVIDKSVPFTNFRDRVDEEFERFDQRSTALETSSKITRFETTEAEASLIGGMAEAANGQFTLSQKVYSLEAVTSTQHRYVTAWLQRNELALANNEDALVQSRLELEAQITELEDDAVDKATASALDLINARVGYCVIDGEPTGAETPDACSAAGGEWISAPLAEALRAVRVELPGGGTATVSQLAQAFEDEEGQLVARGALLTDNDGRVSGFINTNTGETSQLDLVAALTRIGDVDAQGNFVPLLALNATKGVLDIKARLVLEDGHAVETLDDIRAQDGPPGPPGPVGAGFYGSTYTSISWSLAYDRFTALVGRNPVPGDIFVQTRTDGTDSQARQRNASNNGWDTAALQVNGSIIALGTIAGNRLVAGAEIVAPVLKGGVLILADDSLPYMGLYGLGFGSNNQFLEWYGPRNSDTWNSSAQEPRWANLTYARARYFRDVDGEYTRDVVRNVNSGSSATIAVSHLSQGNPNTIEGRVRVSVSGTVIVTGGEGDRTETRTITLTLRRGSSIIAAGSGLITIEVTAAGAGGEEESWNGYAEINVSEVETVTAGNVSYSLERTSIGVPAGVGATYNSTISTLEVRS